jgi:hypothetical protein
MTDLHTETLTPGPYDEKEILRYAMQPVSARTPEALPLAECLRMAGAGPVCRGIWRVFPLTWEADGLDLSFARTDSVSLRRWLRGCDRAALFAVTAGVGMDQLIRRAQVISPVHGLLMHAIGAERVEAACDLMMERIAAAYPDLDLCPRFSPGYGDLPLALQRDVFRPLPCERLLGLTLTEAYLMQPGKSVTALVGLKGRDPA